MNDECLNELSKLTGKKHILLTKRGNVSIRLALKLAKHLGFMRVLLQDQGGWLTYKQFCAKEKLEVVEITTIHGVMDPRTIEGYEGCVLLINSMPAYSFLQDMSVIENICNQRNIFLINDVSGSIGTDEAKHGDVVLGSFGIDKPVNLGSGGFIAADRKEHIDFLEKSNPVQGIDHAKLAFRLLDLPARLGRLTNLKNKLIEELEAIEFGNYIINRNEKGINILVRYCSESQKQRLINYCAKKRIEYTLCPRSIRVNERAVCFELKRK